MEIKFPLKVALFDVDSDRLESMRFDLEDIDCIDVACFTDAQNCFERMRSGDFHILISDMNMPAAHGDQMLDELIRMENGLKTIVVANSDDDVDISHYFELGAANVVLRPIQKTRFIAMVANVINFFREWGNLLDEYVSVERKAG